jgi:hypothetical protein
MAARRLGVPAQSGRVHYGGVTGEPSESLTRSLREQKFLASQRKPLLLGARFRPRRECVYAFAGPSFQDTAIPSPNFI